MMKSRRELDEEIQRASREYSNALLTTIIPAKSEHSSQGDISDASGGEETKDIDEILRIASKHMFDYLQALTRCTADVLLFSMGSYVGIDSDTSSPEDQQVPPLYY